MTIKSEVSKAKYIGNGETLSFAVPFKFFKNEDDSAQINVYIGDKALLLKEKIDYEVIGAGDERGGAVIFYNPPESGEIVAIIRNVPAIQETRFIEGEDFPAKEYENSLDKQTMLIQSLSETISRAVVLTPTSEQNPTDLLYETIRSVEDAMDASAEAVKSAEGAQLAAEIAVKAAEEAVGEINKVKENAVKSVTDEGNIQVKNVTDAANEQKSQIEQLVESKTNTFYINVDEKQTEFNANATEKQDAIDASAAAAAESAEQAAASAAQAGGGVYNRVHDCILENPYHLNYKIEGDTFTLLPGSVLAYPDGSKVVTDTEISGTIPDYNSNILGIVDDNSIFFFSADGFNYGSIKPDAFMGVYPFWLDTANKVLKKRNETQTDYEGSYPLPIVCSNCAITGQGAVLDCGAGLLCMSAADGDNLNSHGMTIFVPAGIKGLIPNGFKTDGSFDNMEYVTPFSFKELASFSDSIKRINAYEGEEKPIEKIHFAMTNSGEIDVSNRGYKINRNNYLVNRDTGNIVMGFELGFAVPGYIIDYEIGGSNCAYVEGVAHIKSTLDLQYPISIIYWND